MKKSNPTWLNTITHIAWDLDGTLYPPSKELSQYIDDQVIAAIAARTESSRTEAKEKFKTKYSELHSTTQTLNSFGINGKEFFISIWEDHDLSPFIQPNHKLATAFEKLINEKPYLHLIHTNSNTLSTVQKKLALIGLDTTLFEQIITSVDVGHNKPDKRMFTALVELTGTTPENILYVGDREHTDIIPANNMGMKTALVSATITSLDSIANITVKRVEQLLEMLH